MTNETRHPWIGAAICASLAAITVSAYAPGARACGGLFCNRTQPVNQAAERIIFSDNPDDTVTAVVQIMYQGPSQRFAWVLPVPGEPVVEVSSSVAFNRLQQMTNPSYRMNTTVEGACKPGDPRFGAGIDNAANGQPSTAQPDGEAAGVEIVNSGTVGPYDYTTISVQPGNQHPTQVALDWLSDNHYDVSALGEDTIGPYLENGMNLLAFRLTKDSDTGDIRPVRITYDAQLPMIPIKLTAVAANDDMGVMAWVLSDARAVPKNYKSLQLNQAAIDWFNPANNYTQVVNRAADEANGQGFVTEMAWPTDQPLPTTQQFGQSQKLGEVLLTDREEQSWSDIEQADWTDRHGSLLRRSRQFANWDGYAKVIDATVPLPDGVDAKDFGRCRNGACGAWLNESNIAGFDPQTFVDQLDTRVIEPMQATQKLLGARSYLTRLYTTMSAADMTLDPVFDFNSSLDDMSNQHVAERIIECGDKEYTRRQAPWRVELPQGDVVYGSGRSWPMTDAQAMPATRTIAQAQNVGASQLIVDNRQEIDGAVATNNARISDAYSGGGACQVSRWSSPSLPRNISWALLAGAFGLVLVRVRRRQR